MAGSVRVRRRRRPLRAAAVFLALFAAVFAAVFVAARNRRRPDEVARASGYKILVVQRAGEKQTFAGSPETVPLCAGDILEIENGSVRVESADGDRIEFQPGSRLSVGGQKGALAWRFDSGFLRILHASGSSRVEVGQFLVRPEADASVNVEAREPSAHGGEIVVYAKLGACELRIPDVLVLQFTNGDNARPKSRSGARIVWDLSGYRVEGDVEDCPHPVVLTALKDKSVFELGKNGVVRVSGDGARILGGTVAVRSPAVAPSVSAAPAGPPVAPAGPAKADPPPAKPETPPVRPEPGPPSVREGPGPDVEPKAPEPGPGTAAPPGEAAKPDPSPPKPADPAPAVDPNPSPAGPGPSAPAPAEPKTPALPEPAPRADPPPPDPDPKEEPPAPPKPPDPGKAEPPPARPPAPRAPSGPSLAPGVVCLKGSVTLVREGRETRLAPGRTGLRKGDRIRVGPRSRASVEIRAGVRYHLEENSEFLFDE